MVFELSPLQSSKNALSSNQSKNATEDADSVSYEVNRRRSASCTIRLIRKRESHVCHHEAEASDGNDDENPPAFERETFANFSEYARGLQGRKIP